MKRLTKRLIASWYQPLQLLTCLLLPLTMLFTMLVKLRRWLYQHNLKRSYKLPEPVIVVGNVTVGGTGKTPLVIYLAKLLQQHGYRPGIISRGYGGKARDCQTVTAQSDPVLVGDEPVLIAQQVNCPIIIGRDRVAAAQKLLAEYSCNVLLSDDGLQHYRLRRDIEIVVVDGERRFGNGFCLPSGPLREPMQRLRTVDFVVTNGAAQANEFSMQLRPDHLINLLNPQLQQPMTAWQGKTIHALAGIGHPQRFFDSLEQAGLTVLATAFADHHFFVRQEITFADNLPVVMTQKDAVKCQKIANEKMWYLSLSTAIDATFAQQLLQKLTARGARDENYH